MATLVSPGVSVSVTDESFYAPAGAGTVPLIVIATAQDKIAPDGISTAGYTTSATANNLYLITSQRELLQNFGNPSFKVIGGTPIHGDETNEYGLAAAYSFLGISNRAYVLRADVDLSQLEPSITSPSAAPADGTYWLDTTNTVWGMKRYDGTSWQSISSALKIITSTDMKPDGTVKPAFGVNGDVGVRYFNPNGTTAASVLFYEKVNNQWYIIGSASWISATSNNFQYAPHTQIPTVQSDGSSPLEAGDFYLQTTSPNNGTSIEIKRYNALTGQFVSESISLFANAAAAYDAYISAGILEEGVLFAQVNPVVTFGQVIFKQWNGGATVTLQSSAAISDTALSDTLISNTDIAFNIFVNDSSTAIPVYLLSSTGDNIAVDDVVADIQLALSSANATLTFSNQITASNVSGKVTLVNTLGRDIRVAEGNGTLTLADLNLTNVPVSNFEILTHTPDSEAPVGETVDGTLWYDADISTNNIDMLVHDGSTWVTLTTDFQTKATEPTTQSDNTALENGDVWLDSSDTENLKLYKYSTATSSWVQINLADQSSPEGIIFADFRQSASSGLDADAPSAVLYPAGMLGWNYRASGGNVKQWTKNYTINGVNIGDVWVSYSGNKSDGSPYLLRQAQRRAVVRGLQAALVNNQDIRNETNRFNLVAVPGYPECTDEMLSLSTDRKDTVFAIIDSPLRLSGSATAIQRWATNANNAVENGEDGLLSASSQAAVYYPSGLTTNVDGNNVLVPASHMVLRTYAFNDQVAFPWFAPAGFQRGLVNNATSVGYLDSAEGEYVPVSLNEGQRDTLYLNKVNPITSFPGRGITVFGQKTLSPVSSALDRVNVSRLVIYIREQLDDAVRPFLFEPNDEVTRANAKTVVDRLLGELISQRGLFDFIVVCDETNNTPARIDRNELHIDVAIQPVKAVEFIYIPIRIQNTLGSTG
jgi:hypothetical protein